MSVTKRNSHGEIRGSIADITRRQNARRAKAAKRLVRLVCGHNRLIEIGSHEDHDAIAKGWTWCFTCRVTEAIAGWKGSVE